jgi:hypothetical protein
MITGFIMIVLLVLFLYYKSNFHGGSELHFSTHCSGSWSLELFVLSNWTNRKDTLIKMQQEERKKVSLQEEKILQNRNDTFLNILSSVRV